MCERQILINSALNIWKEIQNSKKKKAPRFPTNNYFFVFCFFQQKLLLFPTNNRNDLFHFSLSPLEIIQTWSKDESTVLKWNKAKFSLKNDVLSHKKNLRKIYSKLFTSFKVYIYLTKIIKFNKPCPIQIFLVVLIFHEKSLIFVSYDLFSLLLGPQTKFDQRKHQI